MLVVKSEFAFSFNSTSKRTLYLCILTEVPFYVVERDLTKVEVSSRLWHDVFTKYLFSVYF
jgi:hypothetical protein